jgi:hypothetical protein
LSGDARIARGLFVLAAVAYAWFFGGAGWNQDAHFDLTRALVERRTLFIDGYDVNTGDVSQGRGGHIFINKAPGVSLLAALPYAMVYMVEKALHAPIDAMVRRNSWMVTAATCGLCSALIAPLLYLYGRRRAGASSPHALAVALAIAFGTIVFPYSTMLFAHVPAALFLLVAVTQLRERPLLAGAAAGAAATCFYVNILAAVILATMALLVSRRHALRFVLGALPFALLLGLYQWRCFGSPFRTAVEASTFTQKGLLFGVLRLPSIEALYGITLSPYRGLFFTSPVLLFAFAGAAAMARRREARPELIAVAAITVTYFMVIAAFNGWNGGWAFGPRYVLPVVPLLGIPMLYRPPRALWIATAALSVSINFLATAIQPMSDPDEHNPVLQLLHGNKVALLPGSGNLGELAFGEHRRSSVVPMALWIGGGSWLLWRDSRRRLKPALRQPSPES